MPVSMSRERLIRHAHDAEREAEAARAESPWFAQMRERDAAMLRRMAARCGDTPRR